MNGLMWKGLLVAFSYLSHYFNILITTMPELDKIR
jgi:hypothetical protein